MYVCDVTAVALLHPSGEPGERGGPVERETLEDLQPVGNPGDGSGARRGRQGQRLTTHTHY